LLRGLNETYPTRATRRPPQVNICGQHKGEHRRQRRTNMKKERNPERTSASSIIALSRSGIRLSGRETLTNRAEVLSIENNDCKKYRNQKLQKSSHPFRAPYKPPGRQFSKMQNSYLTPFYGLTLICTSATFSTD
jgi:hypothetical protein